MSQIELFIFGCCIFFIVGTGAMLYGMALVKDEYEKQNVK
jgi:hypothetical protein